LHHPNFALSKNWISALIIPMSILHLTSTQLRQAADLKERIAALANDLAALFSETGAVLVSVLEPAKRAKKGGMSVAGRARIVAAQKLRWAKVNAAKAKPLAAVKPKKKSGRKMSAAGRAAISTAAKARWAKVRTAKK
jgi:hypothetical protein